jgi:hypothetical protein
MKLFLRIALFAPLVAVLSLGCKEGSPAKPQAQASQPSKPAESNKKEVDDEKAIAEALAKLSPEDRKLAEAQKFCAVEDENRLGSMGVPKSVKIKGETVFVCCKGCIEDAQANPDKTLAKLKELKEKNKPAEK